MAAIGIAPRQIRASLRILAGLLHLGNVRFSFSEYGGECISQTVADETPASQAYSRREIVQVGPPKRAPRGSKL